MAQTPRDLADSISPRFSWRWMPGSRSSGKLDARQLAYEVALTTDRPDFTRHMRQEALIATVEHLIETHHWTLSWDSARAAPEP